MISNVRVTEVPTKFDIALALMNAIDNAAHDLVKYHQEERKELTLSCTVEWMKAVEMKPKDTNTPVTDTANKAPAKGRSGRKCFYSDKPGGINVSCSNGQPLTMGKNTQNKPPGRR